MESIGKEKTKIYFRVFFYLKELLKVVNTSVNKASNPPPPNPKFEKHTPRIHVTNSIASNNLPVYFSKPQI